MDWVEVEGLGKYFGCNVGKINARVRLMSASNQGILLCWVAKKVFALPSMAHVV